MKLNLLCWLILQMFHRTTLWITLMQMANMNEFFMLLMFWIEAKFILNMSLITIFLLLNKL